MSMEVRYQELPTSKSECLSAPTRTNTIESMTKENSHCQCNNINRIYRNNIKYNRCNSNRMSFCNSSQEAVMLGSIIYNKSRTVPKGGQFNQGSLLVNKDNFVNWQMVICNLSA